MRIIAGLNWAGWLLAGGAHLCAQTPAAAPRAAAAAEKPAASKHGTQKAKALEAKLPTPTAEPKPNFDLSAARQERFKKFLPKSSGALSQREAYHIVALGDSVFDMWSDEGTTPVPVAFPAAFARELAAQFFYTGGVYTVGAKGGDRNLLGPAIGVRQLARPGGSILDAPRILATTARQTSVNLVLLCYGQSEAQAGMSPITFTHAVQDTLDAAKEIGADVIICSPWLPLAERAETQLGVARPLSDALREIAQQEGVLFVDLGDLCRMVVPEPTKADEGRVFDAIERTYRGFFHADESGRFIPRAAMHSQLGGFIFRTLLDGPLPVAWHLGAATATLADSDHLSIHFPVENPSDKPLEITVLPLIANGWKPLQTTPRISLPAGGKQSVTAEYARISPDAAPIQEPLVRLPVLITAGTQARVEDIRAQVQPLAIVWSLETLFNQESSFSAGCQLVNNSGKSLQGTWQAEFGGKRLEGKFDLKPQAVSPLDLHFNLPTDDKASQVLPLTLTVKVGGTSLVSHRQVEIVRNLGLNQAVGLRPLDGLKTGADEIALKATANDANLILSCALSKADILSDAPADGSPAWQLEVNLDARSYGKRLERGSTATLHATGSASDGAGKVHEIAPWAFGNDYAAVFDPKEFKAALTTSPQGKRQISLIIPRTYLYMHEWALNNGNSQLGINVRLSFRHAPLGAATSLTTYAFMLNTNAPEDVESLGVLELSTAPTKRVTVSVY